MEIKDISQKISDGIEKAVSIVVKNKEEYYKYNPSPSKEDVAKIIWNCSNKNASISGGMNLIPGTFGMAASIPEILLVISNQFGMIYDIAKAYGKKEISKELLLGLFMYSVGNVAGNILIIQSQKIIVKKAGASVLQKIISMLGGKITQKLASSMAAKWIPVAGAVAMAAWSRYTTNELGKKAISIFEKYDIEVQAVEEMPYKEVNVGRSNQEDKVKYNLIAKIKIMTFINLIKIRGVIQETQTNMLKRFIDKFDLDDSEKIGLLARLNDKNPISIDYSPIKDNSQEILFLLIDLIAMANCDNNIHPSEKLFIKEVAKILEYDLDDLELLYEK